MNQQPQEPEPYWLQLYLRTGQILTLKTTKQEALLLSEDWQTHRKNCLRWFQLSWRKKFWSRFQSIPGPIPYIGGVGWGVSLTDVVAVWSEPVTPPPENESLKDALRVQKEILDLTKKQIRDQEDYDGWNTGQT